MFEGYPDYNFTISGLSNPSANTFYGYAGFVNGKHFWRSLDNAFSFYYENNNWYFAAPSILIYFVSDQQNVNYPWNVTTWTYLNGDLQGTPVFTLVPFNKSNIVVSGINSSGVEGIDLNGTYVLGITGFGDWWGDAAEEEVGINLRRPFYVKTNGYSSQNFGFENWSYIIRYNTDAGAFAGDRWWLYNNQVAQGFLFSSEVNAIPYYPTDVTPWVQTSTITGTPVLTFASSQNTFGLPADVVALITSRFGSVANFLRLRNLGQI